jgi:TonB family protein
VAKARPNVDQGKPSVTANDKGTTADNADSDQANTALKSLVDTTTFGGAKVGEGKGGVGGGSDPGAGGTSGIGAKSVALGDGPGSLDGPREKRRLAYFTSLQKRLGPLVASAFPREEELELRSGTVIVDLVIGKAGNVLEVIVVRPSGFVSFDKNVVDAIRTAGVFEPVPDVLSMTTLTVRVPVQGGWRLH